MTLLSFTIITLDRGNSLIKKRRCRKNGQETAAVKYEKIIVAHLWMFRILFYMIIQNHKRAAWVAEKTKTVIRHGMSPLETHFVRAAQMTNARDSSD